MSDKAEDFISQTAAFQKMWLNSMSKAMQAAFAAAPDSPPPELSRQIRDAIFQALAEAWNEFLRSPQFQASMKEWMEQAVAFRKMSNDLLAKTRKEMQAPTSGDVDAIMLAVRHLETRILDRVEELSQQVQALETRTGHPKPQKADARRAPKNPPAPPPGTAKTPKP